MTMDIYQHLLVLISTAVLVSCIASGQTDQLNARKTVFTINIGRALALGADLISYSNDGFSFVHFLVSVQNQGLLSQLGFNENDQLLAIELNTVNKLPGAKVIAEFSHLAVDQPFQLLIRRTANPCDVEDIACYQQMIETPKEQFTYMYVRGNVHNDGGNSGRPNTRNINNDPFHERDTATAGDADNDAFCRGCSQPFAGLQLQPPRLPSLELSGDDRDEAARVRDLYPFNGVTQAVKYAPGSANSIPFDGQKVTICTFTFPQVCACQVGSSITTCCSKFATRWFKQVPVYEFLSDTLFLMYKSPTSSLYVRGGITSLTTALMLPFPASLEAVASTSCSGYKYHRYPQDATVVALELSTEGHYFLTLKRCVKKPPTGLDDSVSLKYDSSSYSNLDELSMLQIFTYSIYYNTNVPNSCL